MANGYSLIGADKITGALPPKVREWMTGVFSALFDEKLQTALSDGTIGAGGSGGGGGTPDPVSGGYDGGDLGNATVPGATGGYDGGTL